MFSVDMNKFNESQIVEYKSLNMKLEEYKLTTEITLKELVNKKLNVEIKLLNKNIESNPKNNQTEISSLKKTISNLTNQIDQGSENVRDVFELVPKNIRLELL